MMVAVRVCGSRKMKMIRTYRCCEIETLRVCLCGVAPASAVGCGGGGGSSDAHACRLYYLCTTLHVHR